MNPSVETEPVVVIMAGGAGERFWPVSNRTTPKQFLRLQGGKTMLEVAFDRASKIVPQERIYVAAGEQLRAAILKTVAGARSENYIAEPFARNTAGCLGLAACWVESRHGPNTVIGVLTADHVIEEGEDFFRTIAAAIGHASRTEDLVTIGIEPKHPETAFGYLEAGEEINRVEWRGESVPAYRVRRFTEKPDLETANSFLAQGNYYWNSGMFFWQAGALLRAFDEHQPAMAEQWRKLREAGPAPYSAELLREVFSALPSLPIDTAILEKSGRVATVKGRFAWEDVGSWDAIARIRQTDEAGNCKIGSAVLLESRNNIVYNDVSEGEDEAPEIVLHGIDDLVVVRTKRAILITPKLQVQKVKNIVRHLLENQREDLL